MSHTWPYAFCALGLPALHTSGACATDVSPMLSLLSMRYRPSVPRPTIAYLSCTTSSQCVLGRAPVCYHGDSIRVPGHVRVPMLSPPSILPSRVRQSAKRWFSQAWGLPSDPSPDRKSVV